MNIGLGILMDSNFTEVQLGRGSAHKLANESMREAIIERIVKNYGLNLGELPIKYPRGPVYTREAVLKAQPAAPYIFLYIT